MMTSKKNGQYQRVSPGWATRNSGQKKGRQGEVIKPVQQYDCGGYGRGWFDNGAQPTAFQVSYPECFRKTPPGRETGNTSAVWMNRKSGPSVYCPPINGSSESNKALMIYQDVENDDAHTKVIIDNQPFDPGGFTLLFKISSRDTRPQQIRRHDPEQDTKDQPSQRRPCPCWQNPPPDFTPALS